MGEVFRDSRRRPAVDIFCYENDGHDTIFVYDFDFRFASFNMHVRNAFFVLKV